MSTSTADEERAARKAAMVEKARQRELRKMRVREVTITAIVACFATVIVTTSLGWLTTQHVVKKARAEGTQELATLKANICKADFQNRPDAAERMKAFNALQWSDKEAAVRKFIADQKLAQMPGEGTPTSDDIDKCVDAIIRS